MFTSAKIRNGSTYLGNHLSANDYYAQGERVIGAWMGATSRKLGLSGVVTPEAFEALRVNLHPVTGDQLTPRTKDMRRPTLREAMQAFAEKEGRKGTPQEIDNFRLQMKPVSNRVAFFDFQCSAPKSVSIMAVLAGDRRLREAHEGASKIALGELERFASRQKNTATERQSEITGNICAAAFTHDASRALDPQLHTHFLIANVTCAPNGRWYALNEYEMIKAVRYAGKVYQNELARAVRGMGYDVREVRDRGVVTGFEIEGVSDAICQRFSKRREEIEREIQEFERKYGREPSAKEVALMTRETRSPGLKETSTRAVRDLQRSQLTREEWAHLCSLAGKLGENAPRQQMNGVEQQALDACIRHLFERQSVFKEHEILAEALNQSLGSLDLGKLKSLLRKEGASLVRLAESSECSLLGEYCTREGLQLELQCVELVNRTKGAFEALNEAFQPSSSLSKEQADAVHIILGSHDQVISFRGVAGAGKTTTLREVSRGLSEAGHTVIAITPTTSAAKVLQSEGFPDATTVEDFIRNGEKRGDLSRAVVICDEAGLKSNRQGADLLRLASKYRLRVLLVGDVRQHVSVEAGDFLRVLEEYSRIEKCQVGEIHRQILPDYRKAISQMAMGDVRTGLEHLDSLGWIKEGRSDYLKSAAEDYLRLTDNGQALDRCLAVSFTWDENHRFTEAIRTKLKERGALPKQGISMKVLESLRWTNQQKRDWRNYAVGQIVTFPAVHRGEAAYGTVQQVEHGSITVVNPSGERSQLDLRRPSGFDVARERNIEATVGDKLLIRANDKRNGLINGQVLTVTSIDQSGRVQTREGVDVPSDFRHWCHGYVVTSHKAQGWTTDHVVIAAETLTAKNAYVSCSRGRHTCSLHTPDIDRLWQSLPQGNRKAALDVVQRSGRSKSSSLSMRAKMWKAIAEAALKAIPAPSRNWFTQQSITLRSARSRWQNHLKRTQNPQQQTQTKI